MQVAIEEHLPPEQYAVLKTAEESEQKLIRGLVGMLESGGELMSAVLRAITFDAWVETDEQRCVRLRFLAERIHRLGPRPLFELFRELDAGANFAERAEKYARLPGDFIRNHGGDRLIKFRIVRDGGKP